MSFVARNNPTEGKNHRSRFSLYEDDNADSHEEYQSTRSELPAEVPDSQPDPYLPAEIPDSQPDPYLLAEISDSQPDPYLPAEIPDSQPDVVYPEDLPFGDPDYSELSSQLPSPDHGDLHLGDANAFDFGDYDLGEEETLNPHNCILDNQEEIESRVNRFDRLRREEVGDIVYDKATNSPSSKDTEIIPGGTRLTERRKDRIVSLYHHPPMPSTLLLIYLEPSRPHSMLFYASSLSRNPYVSVQ